MVFTRNTEFDCNIVSSMDRLQAIFHKDKEWGAAIVDFIDRNPVFKPYLPIVAMENKYKPNPTIRTVKDCILYYICYAGVNRNYGAKCWDQIRKCKDIEQVEQSTISPKKKEYLLDAFQLPEDFSISDLDKQKIRGIGPGGIAYINRQFGSGSGSDRMELVEYTDRGVQDGLKHIYDLPKRPTLAETKKIVQSWGKYKSVGHTFCVQAFNYGHHIKKPVQKSIVVS